jgi:ribosomal protein S18 acetylase RimI-like enzyme
MMKIMSGKSSYSLSNPVSTDQEVAAVARLAEEIWWEHFPPIIGDAQVAYMLARFQSERAIADQIAQGASYAYILRDGVPVGYVAFAPDPATRTGQLSKLYVLKSDRRGGAGRAALAEIIRKARALGLTAIWLTVNRNNHLAIRAYEKMGFRKDGAMVTDIGGGFVMDDYRMALSIDSS